MHILQYAVHIRTIIYRLHLRAPRPGDRVTAASPTLRQVASRFRLLYLDRAAMREQSNNIIIIITTIIIIIIIIVIIMIITSSIMSIISSIIVLQAG